MRTRLASALLAVGLLGGGAARAGRLAGPIIDDVTTDRVMYAPGQPVDVTVDLRGGDAPKFSGRLTLTMWNGRGEQVDEQRLDVPSDQNQSPHFTLHPPSKDGRGYMLAVRAEEGDGKIDVASAAVDVSADWKRFPRYGWVGQFGPGIDGAKVVALLAAYHLNALQFYDVAYKAHVPQPPADAASWPNLANQTVSRAVVRDIAASAHARGMIGLLFTDWTAGYEDYATDGGGAKLAWGLFERSCSKSHPCTQADQHSFSGGPGVWKSYGWVSDSLKVFDPSNAEWRTFIFNGVRKAIADLGLDGWQIDTLGAPTKPLYAIHGDKRDMGAALVGFANAAVESVGGHIVLNDVSRWDGDAVAAKARTDILYAEIHPEFGDTAFYPAVNGFASQARKHTSKPLVIAAYMDQGLAKSGACKGSPSKCVFGEPGIRYVDSMMMAAGASHFELGDRNPGCELMQPKMASNIFLPGPMLCMGPSLARWIVDAANFQVGYENMLRDGTGDAVEQASLSGPIPASATGEAGKVYLLPKTRPGFQILHVLNFAKAPTIKLDDQDGAQPAPEKLTGLKVTMHYAGGAVSPTKNRLMWASPDVEHGAPQRIAHYTVGQDKAGRTIAFSLPTLEYWDMVWLETGVSSRK